MSIDQMTIDGWMLNLTVLSVACAVVSVYVAIRSYMDTRKRVSAEALWQILKSWGSQDMRKAKEIVLNVRQKFNLYAPGSDSRIETWQGGAGDKDHRQQLDEIDAARHKCLHHFECIKAMKDAGILDEKRLLEAAKPADVAFLLRPLGELTKRLKPRPDEAVFEFFEKLHPKWQIDEAAKRYYGGN